MSTASNMALAPQQTDFAYNADNGYSERVQYGWRRGKPVEDPEKTKSWGFVTAKPSEYLIHMRRGRILRRSTGQGGSCFKWPWDSVAIIPTSINRMQFTTDQVTLEKVGVQVTGLAVYRIVDPEITFRMLNFSFSERATEKLADILREMFVGATRRHVANLTVEQVITRRKDAIAGELMAELAPLMRGHGQTEDTTPMGWGVVLDTVEIQDVRVLSDAVFRDMQAEFRAKLALRARTAELDNAQEVAAREAASARAIEEAKLSAENATRQLRAQTETRSTEIELAEESRREALRARVRQEGLVRGQDERTAQLRLHAELEGQRASQDEEARLAALAREQRIAQAERELIDTRHENAMRALAVETAEEQGRARVEAERREAESLALEVIRRRDLALERQASEVQAAHLRDQRAVENTISDERIRMALVEQALPAMAQAFAQQFGEVRFTQFGGEVSDPAAMVARALAQVFEIAQSFGLSLGPKAPAPPPRAPAGEA